MQTCQPIKHMDLAEFQRSGYLQEVNRRILHPLGLALEMGPGKVNGTIEITGVWDYRDDPEGIAYGPEVIDPVKVAYVDAELERHADARRALLGDVIQQPDAPLW